MPISAPVGIAQVHKGLLHELAHEHHELVKPQAVDAEPLSPHGGKEHPKVPGCNLRIERPLANDTAGCAMQHCCLHSLAIRYCHYLVRELRQNLRQSLGKCFLHGQCTRQPPLERAHCICVTLLTHVVSAADRGLRACTGALSACQKA